MSGGIRFEKNLPELLSTVTARKCGCCDHHEIGVLRADGSYLALKPGMKVILYDIPKEEEEKFEYPSPT